MAQNIEGRAMSDLSLNKQLCFSVYSANLLFNRVYKPLLDPLGLTYSQYLVMLSLWEKDERTVGSLGDELFLDSSTMTPLLKRLQLAGLVERKRDTVDERQVRICLTEQGKNLRDLAINVPSCVVAALGLPREQLEAIGSELNKVRSALCQT